MTTEVETGHGSKFWLDDAGGTPVLLGEITNVPIPSGAAELIKASHMATVGFHDYIQSPLKEGEEADLEINWIPGNATDALCRAAVGKTRDFKIELIVGEGTWEILGSVLVRDYKRQNPMEAKRSGTLKVKWVGETTEAAGA